MERTDILELMSRLKLFGMRAAYDEVMATGIKRRHEPPRIVGDLLSAEIAEKQARSIKYQLTIAKLPLAKDIDNFDFTGTPINEALIRDLATGGFIVEQRNAVLIGGTGTGKSHLAIAIARACIRGGLSLAGVRLIIPITRRGFPCCVRLPCVHAAATTPVQLMGDLSLKLAHPYQPSPKPLPGRPAHRHFRGLLGVHLRCGLHTRAVTKFVTAIRGLQTFRRLHACPGCFRLERSPGGACTRWKAPPCHGARGKRSHAQKGKANPASARDRVATRPQPLN